MCSWTLNFYQSINKGHNETFQKIISRVFQEKEIIERKSLQCNDKQLKPQSKQNFMVFSYSLPKLTPFINNYSAFEWNWLHFVIILCMCVPSEKNTNIYIGTYSNSTIERKKGLAAIRHVGSWNNTWGYFSFVWIGEKYLLKTHARSHERVKIANLILCNNYTRICTILLVLSAAHNFDVMK